MTATRLSDEPSLHLETLRQITVQMTVARDVAEVLDTITTALVTTAGAALARIWLRRSASECPICRAHNWQQHSMESHPALHQDQQVADLRGPSFALPPRADLRKSRSCSGTRGLEEEDLGGRDILCSRFALLRSWQLSESRRAL